MMTPEFAIAIPSYNSLEYLKICINGIRRNSSFKHQIFVHDNGSTDCTEDWLEDQGIAYTRSAQNEGFCGVNYALKAAYALQRHDHVMIMNADMYPFPGWDMPIFSQIQYFKRKGVKRYTISSCLVEPTGNNPEYNQRNFGLDASSFREEDLQNYWKDPNKRMTLMQRGDTVQYSHPILLPSDMLHDIGYFDVEYFPGWASDHDLAARAYHRGGCQHFVMLGHSRVYHFSSATFRKLPDEVRSRHGEDLFYNKWGQTVPQFRAMIGIRKPYARQR